jgi:hypothetical protein
MKYFIYTRKSTDSEERQVMSLESQLSELKEFAAKEKLEIVLSAPVQGEAGGRGVWGEFRPPSPASSVRIFSNRHRQLGNEVIGSPATRARQPFFGEISSRFEFSKAKSGLF